MTFYVTPTLCLGSPPPFDHTPVATAVDAVLVIDRGGVALLPEDAWDLVDDVLRLLGTDSEWIENQIHFARTGWTRPVQ